MDPITLITTGIAVAKGLAELGVEITPLLGNIKDAINGLFGAGHITDAQATDLHAQRDQAQSDWLATLAAARTEAASGTVTS